MSDEQICPRQGLGISSLFIISWSGTNYVPLLKHNMHKSKVPTNISVLCIYNSSKLYSQYLLNFGQE